MIDLLLFTLGPEETAFRTRLAGMLGEAGITTRIVTASPHLMAGLDVERSAWTAWADLVEPHREQARRLSTASLDELAFQLEDQYRFPSIPAICAPDMAVRRLAPREQLVEAVAALRAWADELTANPCRFVLTDDGPELVRHALWRVAPAHGTELLVQFASVFRDRLLFLDNWAYDPGDVLADAAGIAQHNAEATEFVERLRRSEGWTWFQYRYKSYSDRYASKVLDIARDYVGARAHGAGPAGARRYSLETIRVGVRGVLGREYARRFHTPFPTGHEEPFLFFPLHFTDDAQITVRAPQFHQQEVLVGHIARSLPSGFKLYVKEHPNYVGEYGVAALRRILDTPNVRLIDPRTHPHQLIRASRGVITVNSTAGFEAIVLGKPVITLTRSYYSDKGLTTDVRDLSVLAAGIRAGLARPPDPAVAVSLVAGLRARSFPGMPFVVDASDDNCRVVARSVAAAMRQRASRDAIA